MAESYITRKASGGKIEPSTPNAFGITTGTITENVNAGDILYSSTANLTSDDFTLLTTVTNGRNISYIKSIVVPNADASNRLDLYVAVATVGQSDALFYRINRDDMTITTLTSATLPSNTYHMLEFAYYNNELYLGTLSTNSNGHALIRVEKYNMSANTWTNVLATTTVVSVPIFSRQIYYSTKYNSFFWSVGIDNNMVQNRRFNLATTTITSPLFSGLSITTNRQIRMFSDPITKELYIYYYLEGLGLYRFNGTNFVLVPAASYSTGNQPVENRVLTTNTKTVVGNNLIGMSYFNAGAVIENFNNADGFRSIFHALKTPFTTAVTANYINGLKGFRNHVYVIGRQANSTTSTTRYLTVIPPTKIAINLTIPTVSYSTFSTRDGQRTDVQYFNGRIIGFMNNNNGFHIFTKTIPEMTWSKTNNGEGLTAIALKQGTSSSTIDIFRIEDDEFLHNLDIKL